MPDPRKKLYEALTANNFDLGSYDEFNSKMDNPQSRKKLYDAAGSNDFDLGSYDDFESKIGGKKKSQDSGSTSVGPKSVSAPKTGSSGGQTSMKTFEGLSDNDLKTLKKGDKPVPEINPLVKNKIKEKNLSKELSKVKVTPENMNQVSAKTDEISALKKESDAIIETDRSNKVKQLETSFYDATRDKDDDAIAEQRLQDAVQVKGVWNNVKNIAKNAYNTAVQSIATTQPGAVGLIKYKTDTDPLGEEKSQVKKEAAKNKEKLTDLEVNERAKELFKTKEKDNLFIDRANSFLDNLPEKDKELLKQDRASKADHLEEDNLKRLKVVSAMRTVAENKISEYKNIESQLSKLKDNNEPFPDELYQKYQSLGTEIKNIGSQLQKNEDYILKNKKDLGTAQQEFDLFKREYGDFKNFVGNVGASALELGTTALSGLDYVGSLGGNLGPDKKNKEIQEDFSKVQESIDKNREYLRKPVESVESAEGFINYASDLVANQIPNLLATSTGAKGLALIGTASSGKKFTDMNKEVREGKASYTPLEMAVAPLLYGSAEVVSELPTLSILKKGGRVLESVARNEASLLTKTAKQKAKEWSKDFGVDMSKEMAGEQFTNFAQNFNDKYVLGKKDVNLLDNTGQVFKDTFTLTSILKTAPHMFGAVVKPFQSKTDLGKLDENSRRIIEFSKQLNSEDLTATERSVIQKQIDAATSESSQILANTIGKIDNMPSELYDQVLNLNTKAGEIKTQAREIADGKLSNKGQLIEGLQNEYKAIQEQRNSIIEGRTSAVEVLPLKQQEKIKKQALEDLVTELNPDGKKNMTITDEQILERANEIYSESKSNENVSLTDDTKTEGNSPLITSETQQTGSEVEVNLPQNKKEQKKPEENRVVEYTNGKGEKASLNTNDIDLNENKNKFLFTENGNRIGHIEIKNQDGNEVSVSLSGIFNPSLEKKGIGTIMYKKTAEFLKEKYNKDLVSDTDRTKDSEALWAKLEREGNAVVIGDKSKGNIADYKYKFVSKDSSTKPSEKMSFTEEEKAKVQEKVVSKPRVIVRTGKAGTDAFFALPNEGIYGNVVDKVGTDENVSAYRYPKDFKIKDLSNDVVFDDYMSNKMFDEVKDEGYDAAYVMEIDGSKVLHVINPGKLELLDEKLPELRNNESSTKNDAPVNGNIRPGVDGAESQMEDTRVQNTVNTPTRKGEVTEKLQKINQETFGLDEKHSKANTVVMEKTLETMAKRQGISKEEMFDKISFQKGDSKTAAELSKKGKALFQIIGKSAKLSSETKNFLSEAQKLENQGVNPKEIYLKTGWEKGLEGKWKYDMHEGEADFIKQLNGKLSDVFDYPALFEKYPEAKNIDVFFNPNLDAEGLFDENKNRIFINNYSQSYYSARLTMLHEIQHWIQVKEGFSKGGSTESAREFINNKIRSENNSKNKSILNTFKNLIYSNNNNTKIVESLSKLKEISSKSDFDIYESIAGEVEARNVEKRSKLTPEERKNTPISETEDINRDEQIILSDKGFGKMFQIIGEKANLSKEVKDELLEAQKLENQGVNPKEIYLKTGWEKGLEGKWRYDMHEGKIEFDNIVGNGGEISDVLDYEELYEKYPETRDLKLLFNDTIEGYGFFYPKGNMIVINPNFGKQKSKSTILHELQHWIQMKEGFGIGGNLKSAKEESISFLNKKIQEIEKMSSSENPNLDLINKELSIVNKIYSKEDFDLYESLSGEVESRNVESRMDMSKEDRRMTPISETEDVGRDEQLILFQGEQGAMLAEDGKFIIYALENPNLSTPLHELAHVYEHYLSDNERKTVLEDAGQKEWNRETSEHFARGFEKYLADGIAPNPEMKKLFEDFKKWLTDIYKGITNSEIDIAISPEMQRIYDEMLGVKVNRDKSITVGEYTYQFANNEWVAKDKNGKVVKKKDIPRKVLETHSDNFDFTKGETAIEANKINDISTREEDVAKHSNNPVEVAETLLNARTMDATEGLDTKSKNIAETIGGKGVERSSFAQRAGKKGMKDIPGSLALQYFSKKGKGSGLDIIAQNAEIAMYGDWDSQNPRITEDDVFEFINNNPRGTSDFLNSIKKEKINALKTAFTDLTGLPANDKYLSMAIEQQQYKDKFINEYMTEKDVLSDEDLLNLQTELDQFNKSINEENGIKPSGKNESVISDSEESQNRSDIQSESGQDGGGSQEQKSEEVTNKTSAEQLLDWLDDLENDLDQFGKENLSVGLPIVVAKAAIQAMRLAVKSGMAIADVIQAGLDAVKKSEWFINLSPADQTQAEKDFNDTFGNPQIDKDNLRQTENLMNRAASENISEDEAYDEVSKTFQKEREELKNEKPSKEYLRDAYRNFVKRFTDRQYLSKSLLSKSGLRNTKNLIINAHGASGKAKLMFQDAYDKIYKGLTRADRNTLDEIIQAKRFISIDNNREERGLEPVSHPNFIDKNKSEKFLSKLEKVLGEEKLKDFEKRADAYFKTYKGLLKQVYDNGLISKESFDSMSDVDYQPRVFLQFVTDFNGDLAAAKKTNNLETGGLSSEQIKSMSEGDANSLVLNSEWLLTNSLLARQKAIAMNNINRRFMTEEYPSALKRFESLDPKNLKGDDIRFYKYFKELSSKVIDNPYIGETSGGNPKYKFDKTPANFQKAYYYVDGKQYQFFLEQGLYDSWTDNFEGLFKGNTKEILSYATGSALIKAIATGNNPAFPIVNTPRDFMFTTTFSDQYSNFVPKAMLQVGKDAAKAYKELRKSDSDILKKYIEYGGAMDFLSSEGRLKKNSMVGKLIEKTIDPKAKDVAKSIFNKVTLSKISEYSEMMFRLGIFQRSLKNQLNDLGLKDIAEVTDKQQLDDIYNEAVTNARSILDFNQGGVITKDLEAVVPYINVAFQGGRVAATAFEKDPVGTTSRVLQVATLASAIPIGISLALLSALKPEDDEDKSAYEIYLKAMEGISQYQKMKYMNIPLPIKDSNGEYMVIKIAKAQELSPVMSITDDIYNNMIRSLAGKEKKTAGRIIDDAAFTFNSNVMPLDFTSPAGFFTRTPIVKGTLTYTTGYDFFRDEPLSNDIGKVPLAVEGINNPNVEDFYKKLGDKHGLSPVRSKAFIESLITGPNTNPFVGLLYGGADAVASDKDMSKIGKDLVESVYKSTGKRLISYSSEFNRQLAASKELQEKIDQINIEKYKMKAEFNQLAKDYINKDISKDDLNKKLEKLDPADRKRMTDKIKDKIRLQGIDGTILDIKYEKGNDVKALMIMHYYGDITDGSKDSKEILRQMKRAKGILTEGVIYEYKKLKKELDSKKSK